MIYPTINAFGMFEEENFYSENLPEQRKPIYPKVDFRFNENPPPVASEIKFENYRLYSFMFALDALRGVKLLIYVNDRFHPDMKGNDRESIIKVELDRMGPWIWSYGTRFDHGRKKRL